ncbi:MAG: hypothetical protein M1819_003825 [Sarea resinae]|nr:MAG: hypothetical protein M1819_003825 [Sarea resinae]
MALSTQIVLFGVPIIRLLSLPIPQVFAVFTVILPLITGLSLQTASRLLLRDARRRGPQQARPTLLCLGIFAVQLIYETVIATLSLTYMVPGCALEAQWSHLYRSKDGDAIRRIQDRFQCCGFNTRVDRAWPFPHGRPGDGFGPNQCERMYEGRNRACGGPWRQAEQTHAGLFFLVAAVVFLVKAIILIVMLSKNANGTSSHLTSWMHRSLKQYTNGGGGGGGDIEDSPNRRLIDEGPSRAATDEQEHEPYHDSTDAAIKDGLAAGSDAVNGRGNGSSDSRPRVQPSGLLASGDHNDEADDEVDGGQQQWR